MTGTIGQRGDWVMTAVIIAGGPGNAIFPLANYVPKIALPMVDRPLLCYHLWNLRRAGVREAIVVLAERFGAWQGPLVACGAETGVHLQFALEGSPRGTAGCLADVRELLGGEPFIVLSPDVVVPHGLLSELRVVHRASGAPVTVALEALPVAPEGLEAVQVDGEERIGAFHVLHRSRERRRPLRPAGLYVIDPDVLEHVPARGYVDLKEQFLPDLREKGFHVRAHRLAARLDRVRTLRDYFMMNRRLLCRWPGGPNPPPGSKREIAEGVWVGREVMLSPSVRLLAPVVIGDGCVIEPNALVIGPAVVGDNGRVGSDAVVRESILWPRSRVLPRAVVEYSVVGEGYAVPGGRRLAWAAPGLTDGWSAASPVSPLLDEPGTEDGLPGPRPLPSVRRRVRRAASGMAKRLLDVVVAGVGLAVTCPLFAAIAVAIKLDSPGPALFRQRRCMLDGRPFTMYKFRTMIQDAEAMQPQFAPRKTIDGPMFKMDDDPRVTRVGALLRRTSLDELPQLWNVLAGHMSLVGPRPLVMDEMRFAPHWRDVRLKVKGGITGLWQVNGRSDVAFHDWIRYDIEYVRNRSLGLDLRILWRTLRVVLRGLGAR